MEEESKVNALWKRLPLKTKLIIIGIGIGVISIIMFLIVLIAPLMELGIIDISNLGGSSSSLGYSYIANNTSYWWPIGSDETTTVDGVVYAGGTPTASTITSSFGPRNLTGTSGYHWGMDIATGQGNGVTNIIAVKDGVVIYPDVGDPVDCPSNNSVYDTCNGRNQGGNVVIIQHSNGTQTKYKHLYANTITVKKGDTVKQGQVIGKMGSSGQSTGTHLHIEFWVNGTRVNPANYISKDNPRPKTAAYNSVDGSTTKQTVCLTLLSSGFSENGTAAIMTNMSYESGFKLTALGDSGTSYGLCQWHNSRFDNLRNSFPDTYDTADSQIQFLLYELKNGYSRLYNTLLEGSGTVSDLTYDFCATFERPANTQSSCTKRGDNSSSMEAYVKNGCQ